jgi:hypothetical protein
MKKAVLFCFLLLSSFFGYGQKASFSLEGDTAQITIGEQVTLRLQADFTGEINASLPMLPDTISGLTLVKMGAIDTLRNEKGASLMQKITVTSFDSGFVVIPELSLVGPDGTLAKSKRFIIEVLVPQLSEEQDFYDVKDPLSVKKSLWDTLKWVLLALAILALAGFLFWYLRKQKKPQSAAALRRSVRPEEEALSQLKELEQKELWQKGEVKRYYSELVDILRFFLEQSFGIKAMESTAAELAEKVERLPLSGTVKQNLRALLKTSALVKFAKEKPEPAQNTEALQLVRALVQETIKEEAPHV